MFLLLEVIAITLGLFAILTISSVSLGRLVTRQLRHLELDSKTRVLLDLMFGLLMIGAISSVYAYIGLPGAVSQVVSIILICVAAYCSRSFLYSCIIDREICFVFLIQIALATSIIFTASVASGHSYISPASLMEFTGLPIDLLIPYNAARFFLENIDLASQDVVPGWAVTERGPLSALILSFNFSLFGITEFGDWLVPNKVSYSLAYVVLVYLNTLSVITLLFVLQNYSKHAAVIAVLLLGTTYFYFINILFPWPKFFAASFFILAIFLLEKRQKFISGALLGAAFLAHDSLVFAIAMLFVYLVLQACLDPDCAKSKLKSISNEISPILLGLIVTYLPWVLAKQLYGPESSGRLLYFQILCDKTAEASNQSFTTALLVYLKENPISEIILIRLENLLYPFDVTHPAAQFKQYWMSPLKLVKSISQLAFYQYIFVIGVPVFIAAMVSLVGRFRKEEVFFNKLFLISLSAVLPAAIAFGCPLSSWAHVWAFPAVLGSVAAAGFVLSHRGFGFVILFAAALLNNILFLHSEIYRKRFIPVASSTDLAYQLFPLAICLLLLSYMYFSPNLKEGNE